MPEVERPEIPEGEIPVSPGLEWERLFIDWPGLLLLLDDDDAAAAVANAVELSGGGCC